MKVLFITRKYPPSIGGMETFSFNLFKHLSKHIDTKKISYGGSNKLLPIILPWFLIKSIYTAVKYSPDVVLLGDAMLSFLNVPLRILGKKTIVVCHGLDITYKNALYQDYMKLFFKTAKHYVAVSKYTKHILLKYKIPADKITVINNGVNCKEFSRFKSVNGILKRLNINEHNINLLTVGRLVQRKGVYWFAKNVFSKIKKKYNYIVIGEGPDKTKIEQLGLENLHILGKVSDIKLKSLYKACDLFVMPNITVKNDVEGYGIVALEASSAGLPVIASSVDGITEAIAHNQNGILVEEKNVNQFLSAIKKTNKNFGETSYRFNKKHRSWDSVVKKYIEVFT